MSERYDVGELYERSAGLEHARKVLFYANCLVTVVALWPTAIQVVVTYLQIATAVLHVFLGLINDCGYWFEAESANRRHLFEDAFGVDITNMRSVGYYNNRFEKSAERYVVNAFESTFFSKSVSEAMLPSSVLKSLFALMLLLWLLFTRPNSISLSDATQAILSAYLIEDTILLAAFHSKVSHIYDEFYESMISIGVKDSHQMVLMLTNVQEYECTKAYFKVRLDSHKFDEMNQRLSDEWGYIESRVSFSSRQQERADV